MKNIFCALILLGPAQLFPQSETANKILIPYRSPNFWGYSDTLGNVVISPIYDSIDVFDYKSTAIVIKDKKTGLTD